jgi:hypothetical protein
VATVAQVLKASLNLINVREAEAPIEPDEAQSYIFAMNNWMLDLDANGVSLGYTEVSGVGDPITIPTGALRGLIYGMAVESASDYDMPVSPAVATNASNGLKTMRKLGQRQGRTHYPSTLPIGSGNEGYRTFDIHFYPGLEAEILAETTGPISLETGTP